VFAVFKTVCIRAELISRPLVGKPAL